MNKPSETGADLAGLNMLGLAVEEAQSVPAQAAEEEAALGRQLYIHALTYLLRGLPSDLTAEEQLGIRASLPGGVVEPLRLEIDGNQQLVIGAQGGQGQLQHHTPPSVLHRVLATTIVQVFIIFQFLLPYVKAFLHRAYTYERTHHVSEAILAASIDTVDTIGKRGIELGGAVSKLADGRLGQAVNGLAAWWLEGVAGGICDGLGEGMVILGAGRRPGPGPGSGSGPMAPQFRMQARTW